MKKRILFCLSVLLLTSCAKDSYSVEKSEVELEVFGAFSPERYLLKNGEVLSDKEFENVHIDTNVDINKIGNYTLTYTDFDLKVNVKVVDKEKPELILHDFSVEKGDKFDDDLLKAEMKDNYTKSDKLKETLECTNTDFSKAKKVEVVCTINDESGNVASASSTVTVKEKKPTNNQSSNSSQNNNNNNNTSSSTPSGSYKPSEVAIPEVPLEKQMNEDEKQMAYRLFELINEERKKAGVEPLRFAQGDFAMAAQYRVNEIIEKPSHVRPDGTNCIELLRLFGIGYWSIAEDFAVDQANAEQAFNNVFISDSHKSTTLNGLFRTVAIATKNNCWVLLYVDSLY